MRDDSTSKRIVTILPRAIADIELHATYLDENATPDIALQFRTSITTVTAELAFMPGIGAPRYVENIRLKGLRMITIPNFRNHLIFYRISNDVVEIIRILHGAQDVYGILDE